MGSGSILREVIAAAELLATDFGVHGNVWSVTSLTELRRDGHAVERWNLLHPESEPRASYAEQCLAGHTGPVVVATDYVKLFADQLRPFVPGRRFVALGTDGFGQSDTREALREFFEVDRHFIALAALKALADDGMIGRDKVSEAIKRYGINVDKVNPVAVNYCAGVGRGGIASVGAGRSGVVVAGAGSASGQSVRLQAQAQPAPQQLVRQALPSAPRLSPQRVRPSAPAHRGPPLAARGYAQPSSLPGAGRRPPTQSSDRRTSARTPFHSPPSPSSHRWSQIGIDTDPSTPTPRLAELLTFFSA